MLLSPAAPTATSDVGEGLDRTTDGDVVVPSLTDGPEESAEVSPTLILITEQEVVFGTSSAVALPRNNSTRRLTDASRVVVTKLRRIFLASRARQARRHYPPRSNDYLEHSLMAREMLRL